MKKKDLTKQVKKKQLILLDIGCGGHKQAGYIGMDVRSLPGVDIVHSAEDFPYPLEDGSCSVIVMSHLFEHIKPWLSIDVMNECWRLLSKDGLLLIAVPYATSFGYFQDPTHINPCNEATFTYFDPKHPSNLWSIYQPKPWKIENLTWDTQVSLEVALRKREEK